jgi:hypothetical protein
MSDLNKLTELFASFGMGYELNNGVYEDTLTISDENERVEGYFYCDFYFNTDGSFASVGVWE